MSRPGDNAVTDRSRNGSDQDVSRALRTDGPKAGDLSRVAAAGRASAAPEIDSAWFTAVALRRHALLEMVADELGTHPAPPEASALRAAIERFLDAYRLGGPR